MRQEQQSETIFIVTQGPKLHPDLQTKYLIRRKASIHAARDRRRPRKKTRDGRWTEYDAESKHVITPESFTFGFSSGQPISFRALNSAYESARSRHNADVTQLSKLACFNVCSYDHATAMVLSQRLDTVLDRAQPSYLRYVPCRYGMNECLTLATDCLMLRMQRLLNPASPWLAKDDAKAYGLALRSLREAIATGDSTSSEVLCSSQMLALYELLGGNGQSSYAKHIDGCTKLITHRKPQSFTSDFDKALLIANVKPAIFNAAATNTHCYLEEREWLRMFTTLTKVSGGLTRRCRLAMKLRLCAIRSTGLWIDCGSAMQDVTFFDSLAAASLYQQCLSEHECLVAALQHCAHLRDFNETEIPEHIEVWNDVVCLGMACEILVKRMMTTISRDGRPTLELGVQNTARKLLEQQALLKHNGLYSAHALGIASSAIATAPQWLEDATAMESQQRQRVYIARFQAWRDMIFEDAQTYLAEDC